MNRKHNFEEKLNLVSQVNQGVSISHLCHLHKLDRKMLREWVCKYELHGESGLSKQLKLKASAELKEEVIRLIQEKHVSLPQVALSYGVSQSTLKSWKRIVKTNGYAALYQEKKQGQPFNFMGRKKKQQPETELEKLLAENARLRAENALLKKVTALVEEREARERMSGQKPSKN
jgi:Transposase.